MYSFNIGIFNKFSLTPLLYKDKKEVFIFACTRWQSKYLYTNCGLNHKMNTSF
jgi:hypothetical protein